MTEINGKVVDNLQALIKIRRKFLSKWSWELDFLYFPVWITHSAVQIMEKIIQVLNGIVPIKDDDIRNLCGISNNVILKQSTEAS